jgi:hypothetical protein
MTCDSLFHGENSNNVLMIETVLQRTFFISVHELINTVSNYSSPIKKKYSDILRILL